MPVLPTRAERGRTWVPEVMELDCRYLLFLTAREKESGRQCTGVATSADPLGRDESGRPAISTSLCPSEKP